MIKNPLVSILIPVYNREYIVGETIESAINQTYTNIEIIIVDNCSTDETWVVLKNFAAKDSRIKIFQNDVNVGPVLNWKRCIDEAKGEYGKILFSDDLISENFIEETLAVFDEQTAFVLSKIKVFATDVEKDYSEKVEVNTIHSSSFYLQDVLLNNFYGFSVSPGCSLFRTSDLRTSLIIDIPNTLNLDFKKFGAGNDLLLFLNTALLYSKIKTTNKAVAFFRSHKDSFTISNQLGVYYDFSRLYFIEKHFPHYLSKFKTLTWLKMKKHGTINPIFPLLGESHNWSYGIKFIFKKLK
ncbi:glycosyltransferase family 2 protein [Flavobacterium sp. DSR3-2]|uniref:glycosyltransferase family 2 protein n=1 Tax=Flavobacterium sp. DSR3-2 TaxID=2804634 RepID=UPI003CEA1D5F